MKIKELKRRLKAQAAGPAAGLFSAAASRGKRKQPEADSDEEANATGEGSLFREAPSLSAATDGLQMIARKQPGTLFMQGIGEITKYLGEREGAADSGETGAARTLAYLNSIFHGKHPMQEVGPRTSRELKTLACAIDALLKGELPTVADILMQRFKALELSVSDKSWAVAAGLELIPDSQGLATEEETHLAARHVLLRQKLDSAKAKLSGRKAD